MMISKLKTLVYLLLLLLAVMYALAAIVLATEKSEIPIFEGERTDHRIIAIFGASGTAGDGILKAALADPAIEKIRVITRRATPRIEEGVASGKVQMIMHMDYTDYTAVRDQISDSDAVYWAIGTSSVGVDEATYAMIHVDFPMRFVEQWAGVSTRPKASFHYISSSDISENSSSMWAQQKFRAEKLLVEFASRHEFNVISYRPDYIGPTKEEASLGQDIVFWFFRPVGAAVRARQIGQAMIEVSSRQTEFENGDTMGTSDIVLYSDAYRQRRP